jgi:CheY-like chemotaxis protein/c-di-GMP-binding flagellar brake protein YcgR
MVLQALLVSKDDLTAETLIRVLAEFGVAVTRSNAIDVAISRLSEARFDQVIVDFDADFDPDFDAAFRSDADANVDAELATRPSASHLLEACCRMAASDPNPPVRVALLHDASQIRSILGAGAHFILTKPVTSEQAQKTLRAALALLMRERRQSSRVAVQAAISIGSDDGNSVEGILLDLSTGGMDVLAAKPLPSAAVVNVSFELPDGGIAIHAKAEVAWSNSNGQVGLRFLEMNDETRDHMQQWLTLHFHDTLPEEPNLASECTLTDLSLGGCYVETESPFPQSASIDLCLRASGMEIHTEGLVRIMHPEKGMGIEFPNRTEEQRQSVGHFIEFLTTQPDASPQLEISPRALVATGSNSGSDANPVGNAENEPDALLELLRSGGLLEEEAFLDALHRQRTPVEMGQ